jgi:hypothetical protein
MVRTIALVLLVASIALLYSMYRNIPDYAREYLEIFSKMVLTLALSTVVAASIYYLITGGIK